jgi:hypothetical protein
MFIAHCLLPTIAAHCLLPTVHCQLSHALCSLLPNVYCPLFFCPLHTAPCPLPTVCCPLPTVYFPLLAVHCPLFTTHWPLFAAHCQLFTVHCPLSSVHYPLFAALCLLPTARYTAHYPLHSWKLCPLRKSKTFFTSSHLVKMLIEPKMQWIYSMHSGQLVVDN